MAPTIDSILSSANLSQINVTVCSVQRAQQLWAQHRAKHGFCPVHTPLLTPPSGNVKLAKSMAYGLALAPHRLSGHNTCVMSTAECRKGCVSASGNGGFPAVTRARIAKTTFLAQEPRAFMALLCSEIAKARIAADELNEQLYVRLNTFSDIEWELHVPWLFTQFEDVQFYDYTKRWERVNATPDNYALAASWSDRNTIPDRDGAFDSNKPLAVVFDTKRSQELPAKWFGIPVVDADKSDRWMVEHQGRCIIGGLRAKGTLRTNPGLFVQAA